MDEEKLKELPLYMRAKQAEKVFGISRWALYRLAYQKQVITSKVGGMLLFKTSDIFRLLKENESV